MLIRVVFDAPPGHNSGRFVEVEDGGGRSLKPEDFGGKWVQRPAGYWVLELDVREPRPVTGEKNYTDPTPYDLTRSDFAAVWDEIKSWDINVPEEYEGHCGATGNHVMAILNALGRAGQ